MPAFTHTNTHAHTPTHIHNATQRDAPVLLPIQAIGAHRHLPLHFPHLAAGLPCELLRLLPGCGCCCRCRRHCAPRPRLWLWLWLWLLCVCVWDFRLVVRWTSDKCQTNQSIAGRKEASKAAAVGELAVGVCCWRSRDHPSIHSITPSQFVNQSHAGWQHPLLASHCLDPSSISTQTGRLLRPCVAIDPSAGGRHRSVTRLLQ